MEVRSCYRRAWPPFMQIEERANERLKIKELETVKKYRKEQSKLK